MLCKDTGANIYDNYAKYLKLIFNKLLYVKLKTFKSSEQNALDLGQKLLPVFDHE